MSLIMDATRAAQREKERREKGAQAGPPSLLVPLRGRDSRGFNWMRIIALAGGGGVVVIAAWIALKLTSNQVPRALSTPGPIVQSIAAPPPAPAAAADSIPVASDAPEVARATAGAGNRTTVAGDARQRPAATTPRAGSQEPRAAGTGVMIAVAQPREIEAARLFGLGVAAHRAGDLVTARSMYDQALALTPTDADVLNNLGVLLTSTGEFERAETVLRRVVAMAPNNAGAWNNLGTALRSRGRSPDAVAAFQRALAVDPGHAGARISLAQQYLVLGSLQQARLLLESVLADNPTMPEASYALGQVLERQGDRAGAIRAYITFIRVAPAGLASYVDAVRQRVDVLSAAAP